MPRTDHRRLRVGFALSSEEHAPLDHVRHAARAEEVGFDFLSISDHFHPWTDRQGHSPFVWGVIGAIAEATERIRLGTGVTCPTMRIHPAIIAHAAATAGCLMPGRFFLGVGTGEKLNEHITGERWPEHEVRAGMLEEAVEVIRLLWEGGVQSHHGRYYTVENARVYDLPDPLPEIVVAASGPRAAALAGRIGDGFWSTSPERELVEAFESASPRRGRSRPRYGQVTVCWAKEERSARRTAHQWWPTAGIPGEATQELPSPAHFEQLAEMVTEDAVAEAIVCGPDPERHVKAIRAFVDAGFDHVYVHQVGPDQAGCLRFYQREVLPALADVRAGADAAA
jgi:G6PDH family F420-dependent oxidoreductase